MKLIYGDATKLAIEFDIFAIPTNGTIAKSGKGVMGAGVAKQMKELMPLLEIYLGEKLRRHGNIVQSLYWIYEPHNVNIVSFPVKHNWNEMADINLIEQSCHQLMKYLYEFEENMRITYKLSDEYSSTVLLPRPGCGNGKLRWENVMPVIDKILDDRVYVITRRKDAKTIW